jgi:hypothetical protein
MDERRLTKMAMGWERNRSGSANLSVGQNVSLLRVHTKRTSPESSHGFVVNHSHMKALVEPSLTELIRPLMSLFTDRCV